MSDSDPASHASSRRGRVDGEHRAAEAAGPRAREVDVAVGQAGEEVGGAPPSDWSLPSDVVVAVEDRGHVWSRSIHLWTVTGSHVASAASRSSRLVADRQQRARLRAQEALLHGVVEEGDERLVVAGHVDQPERLGVDAELRPGVDLEELLERADAARQRDEGVGELGHERLALVHGADHPQVVEAGVADLEVEDRLRDDPDDLAARGRAPRRPPRPSSRPCRRRRRRARRAAPSRARRPRRPSGRRARRRRSSRRRRRSRRARARPQHMQEACPSDARSGGDRRPTAASPRRAASACSRASREEISVAARIAPAKANPAPTRNASWKPSVRATARSRTPSETAEVVVAVGHGDEDREAERAADLLGGVHEPRREPRLVGADPRHGGDRHRHEREAQPDGGQDRRERARRRRRSRRAPRPARSRAGRR